MSKTKIFALLAPLFLGAASSPALAHSGHGEWAAFAHSYEHAIWALGAIVAIGVIAGSVRKLVRRKIRVSADTHR